MKSWIRSIGCITLAGVLLCSTGCVESKPEKYTITFVQNGQDNVVVEVPAGQNLKNPPKPKDKTGYTVEWDKTSFENITKDIVVNAVETPNEYLITYMVASDETFVGEYTQAVEFDAQYELSIPTKYGYAFVDWYNGNTPISRNGTWKIADNVSLTARWSDNSYTLTFVHLDNTTETRWLECGDVLAAEDIPTLQSVDGYNVYWGQQDFSNISTNTTIKAIKEAKTFKIEYLLETDESMEGDTTQEVVFHSAYSLKTPTKQGYTFRYWQTEDDEVLAQEGEEWNFAKNVRLKAVWTQDENLITFVHADGSTEERTVKTGEALADIPTPKPVPGYDVYWTVTDFSSITGAMTVNTRKEAKTYTITYDVPDVPELDGETQDVLYNSAFTLATPVRYGYTLTGWKTAEGNLLNDEQPWSLTENSTLTAVWADNYYTITFVQADNTKTSIKVEKGDTLAAEKIPVCVQVPGYTVSWSVTDFTTITADKDVLPDKKPNTYTITFKVRAGETLKGEGTQEVVFGSQYTLETTITHMDKDLVFSYWKNAITGERVPKAGTWKIAGNVTLEAVWEESDEYTKNY